MPRLTDDNLDQFNSTGSFGFSATKLDHLEATEYTLVGIALDDSGSVGPFARDIEGAQKQILRACLSSPRADNLMLRTTKFGNNTEEVNGFKLLSEISPDDYDNILQCQSMTALYDGSVDIIDSVAAYGKDLVDNDFSANAIVFVITDGTNNNSTSTVNTVKQSLEKAVRGETLESVVSVLIGVGLSDYDRQQLSSFHTDAGFTQFIEIADANPKTLAKLAEFISKSISSQSQALGSGGPSQALSDGSLTI